MYKKNTMLKGLKPFNLYNNLKWYLSSLILGILVDPKSKAYFQWPSQNFVKFVCLIFASIICLLSGIFQYNLLLSLTLGKIANH